MKPFDAIAEYYDDEFTETTTGKFQRKIIHNYLAKILEKNTIKNVLEINCGTGEDAIFLAKKGCKVLATDISTKMVEATQQKVEKNGLTKEITTQQLAIEKLGNLIGKYQFDLIFSNFGGLNCVSPTDSENIAKVMAQLLTKNGLFIAVIMPRDCYWERFYFSIKRDTANAKRRRSKTAVVAQLDSQTSIDTWYYNPKEFYYFFQTYFDYKESKGVGLWLPPSYLDSWFSNKPKLLKLLNKIEKISPKGDFWASRSDHFLLQLKGK